MTPKLVAAPGMHIDDVVRASTLPLRPPPRTTEHGYLQPDEPHSLVVRDATHGLELAPGLFSLVETRLGKVQRLRTSPHLEYVDRHGVVALVRSLEATLERANWTPAQTLDDKALHDSLADARELSAGLWRAEWWCAELQVRRAVDAGSPRAQMMQLQADGHLVTLLLWDEQLLEQAGSW